MKMRAQFHISAFTRQLTLHTCILTITCYFVPLVFLSMAEDTFLREHVMFPPLSLFPLTPDRSLE